MIETIIVISVTALVLTVIVDSILTFYRSNTNTLEQTYQVESARRGVDLATRDIREAAYSDNGSFPIVSTCTSTLTFYSDTDRDYSAEQIRFYLEGSLLKRGVINATGSPHTYNAADEQVTILSEYVRNISQGVPVFRYFTASSTEIAAGATTTLLSYITIDLIVNVDVNRLPGEFTLHSTAAARNLKQ